MSYLFRRIDNGELIELDISFFELMERQRLGRITLDDGSEAIRAVSEERARDRLQEARRVKTSAKWPMECVALACHPSQAEQFNEDAKRAGITGAHWNEKGILHIADRGQKAKLLRHFNVVDNDGGYRETRNSRR